MSALFLSKVLENRPARFLRFEEAITFVVLVDGVERRISRDVWNSLPDQADAPKLRDQPHQDELA